MCVFKCLHHLGHRHVVVERRRWRSHQLVSLEMMVKLNAEHHMPNLGYVDFSQEITRGVEHRQETVAALANLVYYLTKLHIGTHSLVVAVDDTVKAHQRQNGVVGVMSDELALLC